MPYEGSYISSKINVNDLLADNKVRYFHFVKSKKLETTCHAKVSYLVIRFMCFPKSDAINYTSHLYFTPDILILWGTVIIVIFRTWEKQTDKELQCCKGRLKTAQCYGFR